ncbi:MAG TPA: radical SAM protein [Syntrophales bacterium]|nr:radical SAM protein [Syntrophales bacterium]HRT71414.1 radical SAM protein [Syntrophales bacterium]
MTEMERRVQARANANFYSLWGSSAPESKSPLYDEYRRCWLEYPSRFEVREFPVHLDLEASSRCNLRCTFCDKLPLMTKEQFGDMDFRLYRKIIDEGRERLLWSVKLSYRGEPLLNPHLAEMVAYAKKNGIVDIYFNSNGMLLTEDMSLKLMDAGLDRISISVEGTDPVMFEKARIGARFDRIVKNIERLMELKRKRGYPHPKVRVQTVCLPHIDLDEYCEFWKERCDEVAAIDFKDISKREEVLVDYGWACPQLWQRMTIEWNGAIIPCNNDDYRLLSPGNVLARDIYSCWHDPIVQRARELHMRGESHLVAACSGCPWRATQVKKDEEQ